MKWRKFTHAGESYLSAVKVTKGTDHIAKEWRAWVVQDPKRKVIFQFQVRTPKPGYEKVAMLHACTPFPTMRDQGTRVCPFRKGEECYSAYASALAAQEIWQHAAFKGGEAQRSFVATYKGREAQRDFIEHELATLLVESNFTPCHEEKCRHCGGEGWVVKKTSTKKRG